MCQENPINWSCLPRTGRVARQAAATNPGNQRHIRLRRLGSSDSVWIWQMIRKILGFKLLASRCFAAFCNHLDLMWVAMTRSVVYLDQRRNQTDILLTLQGHTYDMVYWYQFHFVWAGGLVMFQNVKSACQKVLLMSRFWVTPPHSRELHPPP